MYEKKASEDLLYNQILKYSILLLVLLVTPSTYSLVQIVSLLPCTLTLVRS